MHIKVTSDFFACQYYKHCLSIKKPLKLKQKTNNSCILYIFTRTFLHQFKNKNGQKKKTKFTTDSPYWKRDKINSSMMSSRAHQRLSLPLVINQNEYKIIELLLYTERVTINIIFFNDLIRLVVFYCYV